MINLNDSQYELKTVKIFNGGDAGVVNGVSMRVEKRKPTDADNAPLYKIILTDSTGAEINKGYFDVSNGSEAAKKFFVTEMKHLVHLVEKEHPASVESYSQLLDITMRTVHENVAGRAFNVFVSYGTAQYPSKYLQVGSAFDIVKANEKPYVNPKALLTRVEPTQVAPEVQQGESFTNDLPFGGESSTPPAVSGW